MTKMNPLATMDYTQAGIRGRRACRCRRRRRTDDDLDDDFDDELTMIDDEE